MKSLTFELLSKIYTKIECWNNCHYAIVNLLLLHPINKQDLINTIIHIPESVYPYIDDIDKLDQSYTDPNFVSQSIEELLNYKFVGFYSDVLIELRELDSFIHDYVSLQVSKFDKKDLALTLEGLKNVLLLQNISGLPEFGSSVCHANDHATALVNYNSPVPYLNNEYSLKYELSRIEILGPWQSTYWLTYPAGKYCEFKLQSE